MPTIGPNMNSNPMTEAAVRNAKDWVVRSRLQVLLRFGEVEMDARYIKNRGPRVIYQPNAGCAARQPDPIPTDSHFRIRGSLLNIEPGRGLLTLLRLATDCETSEVRFA